MTTLSCDRYKSFPPSSPPFPPSLTMTNAHERITLPPISSFDISPSRKPHNTSSSRRPPHPHINGSPSWDGSSTASNPPRRDLDPPDDTRYEFVPLALRITHSASRPSLSYSRRSPSTYGDAADYVTSAPARGKHSPYSEPVGLITSCEHPPHLAPRPRSSSASLDRDRRGPVVPQVSCSRFHRFAQRLTWAPSRYPPFHVAAHSRRHHHLAPHHVSSREHSPADSRESLSRSSTRSPLVPTRPNLHTTGTTTTNTTVPSPHSAAAAATTTTPTSAATSAAGASGTRVPSSMTAFINTGPGDTQDVQLGGALALASERERRRTSPVRKRKASEMLGTSASPGSVSPEPSESEAKKKYKKKMNVRHYRAQNKDAMTQLRDALPEHMRPPERQAKAYVTLSGMWHHLFGTNQPPSLLTHTYLSPSHQVHP